MAVGLFIFISWAVISIFMMIPKKVSKINTLFSLFCTTILATNVYTLFELNLHLVTLNQKPMMFLSYCLHRDVIIPVSVLIFIHVYFNLKKGIGKLTITFIVFAWLMFTEFLAVKLGIKSYDGWNWMLASMVFALLMLGPTLLLKWFQKINSREVTKP